ncbi:hypothetical protein EV421DRAFT_2024543 [Armillaria borealis]|uniref:Uncharacterized protein n=1 Tax=Armillaria borealis TaxID=47425 RepID=A0AA39IXC5_9AGAR|nr:hypothetical protein EV421DRAFT_2024543 [Armillaria borealis]
MALSTYALPAGGGSNPPSGGGRQGFIGNGGPSGGQGQGPSGMEEYKGSEHEYGLTQYMSDGVHRQSSKEEKIVVKKFYKYVDIQQWQPQNSLSGRAGIRMATIINLKDNDWARVLKTDSQDHRMKRTALLGPKEVVSKLMEAHSQDLSVGTVSLEITVAGTERSIGRRPPTPVQLDKQSRRTTGPRPSSEWTRRTLGSGMAATIMVRVLG